MLTPTLQSRHRDLDDAVTVFLAERSRLFSVAYRITGEVAAAEDVVQEAWLRWQRTDRAAVGNPAAFLTTATRRLAINVIQSAAHRHETPTDAPLAVVADRSPDPTERAERAAEVEQALDQLMTRLTPGERAVYLLREGFDFPYRDIARMLRTSVPAARQLARRAQRDLDTGRRRQLDSELHRRLVHAFLAAARTGEFAELTRLLVKATVTPPPPARSLGHPTVPGSEGHHREQPLPGTSGPADRRRHRGSPVPVRARP